MKKAEIVGAIVRALEKQIATLEDAQAAAQSEVASDETKREGPYDTRATEASYLARGQAERVVSLRRLLEWFQRLDTSTNMTKIEGGACVAIMGRRRQLVFIAPEAGPTVDFRGVALGVVSPSSPMGSAMEELEVGDSFEVESPTGVNEYQVVEIV